MTVPMHAHRQKNSPESRVSEGQVSRDWAKCPQWRQNDAGRPTGDPRGAVGPPRSRGAQEAAVLRMAASRSGSAGPGAARDPHRILRDRLGADLSLRQQIVQLLHCGEQVAKGGPSLRQLLLLSRGTKATADVEVVNLRQNGNDGPVGTTEELEGIGRVELDVSLVGELQNVVAEHRDEILG